ncbi:hypothetical protein AX16_002911 [Volvariella volvacea WC 439]|nr:hypothetical protein AX16_002911 [Volvariella volvacea WC 439]
MSATWTPTEVVDMSKEKEWPSKLGLLDWDNTKIVFTKRTLIEFLKYAGTTVDPNFTNIAKLPRYAVFGKMEDGSTSAKGQEENAESISESTSGSVPGFKPSRRVRTAPGGVHTDIFANDDDDDALSHAPPAPEKPHVQLPPPPPPPEETPEEESGIDFNRSSFKPTRRVRTAPGGESSLSNFWDAPAEEFKPTRRVRQGPGGDDHINSIL